VASDPESIHVHALGEELSYLARAEALIKSARAGIEDRIAAEIEHGRPVKGWRMGATAGRRYWSSSVEDIEAVAGMSGLQLTEKKPISITAAWKNTAARPLLESLISKSEGSKKLVQFDGTKINEVFK
jgi:hypothetical protein